MALSSLRSRVRRALQLPGAVAAILFSASCADDTTGTDTPGFGNLALIPQFSSAAFAPITLDRVHVIVQTVVPDSIDANAETLLDVTRNFSVTTEELRLSLPVPMSGRSQQVRVRLELLAGPTLLFEGSSIVELQQGRQTTSEEIDLDYIGPGSNASGLIIEPFDTTVTAGSLTPFRAAAIDNQENDVGPFYMRWSVSSTANGASIDASGRLRAPTQAGTIWVRGNLPNGVDDSVQVTVTDQPGVIDIFSGNNQTGEPGTGLELPFVVRVTTTGGASVPGVSVTWAATTGGGSFEVGTTTTDTEGFSQNFAQLGPNPGINRFTATVAGVGSVTFVANEAQTGGVVSWIGNASEVWSNPANWSGGVVPSVLDSVVISSANAEFDPVLDTTPVVGALTLGGTRTLSLNSHGFVVVRNLTVLGNANLVMVGGNDVITVGGNALFDGGDSRGNLTAGVISIVGNFTQRATNSGSSFAPSGDHIVSMGSPGSTVSFATPGLTGGTSGFQDLTWVPGNGGTLTLTSDVVVRRTAFLGFTASSTITSTNGRNLRATQLSTSGQVPLIFNNVTLTLQDTANADYSIGQVTFQNMPTTVAQVQLNYPGGNIALNNWVFSTTPVAPNGFYISTADVQVGDGNSFTVDVSATPTSPGAFVTTSGGAVVRWPPPF